jgi:hypothetical protein
MANVHPDFQSTTKGPGKLIVDGNADEKPIPGSFYCPTSGNTLSGIAKKAYGEASRWRKWINENPYNQKTLVYRATDAAGTCISKKVDPSKGYIALCKNDRADWMKAEGYKMPVIWIPFELGQVPEAAPPDGPLKIKIRPAKITIPEDDNKLIINPIHKEVIEPNHPSKPATPEKKKEPDPYIKAEVVPQSKLGLWLVGIGFVAIILATVVIPAMKGKDKGKSAKGKAKSKAKAKPKAKAKKGKGR